MAKEIHKWEDFEISNIQDAESYVMERIAEWEKTLKDPNCSHYSF